MNENKFTPIYTISKAGEAKLESMAANVFIYEEFLRFTGRVFKQPVNVGLEFYTQKPNARFIGTEKQWQSAKYSIRQGETAIRFIDSNGEQHDYYDLSQTESKKVPNIWTLNKERSKLIKKELGFSESENLITNLVNKYMTDTDISDCMKAISMPVSQRTEFGKALKMAASSIIAGRFEVGGNKIQVRNNIEVFKTLESNMAKLKFLTTAANAAKAALLDVEKIIRDDIIRERNERNDDIREMANTDRRRTVEGIGRGTSGNSNRTAEEQHSFGENGSHERRDRLGVGPESGESGEQAVVPGVQVGAVGGSDDLVQIQSSEWNIQHESVGNRTDNRGRTDRNVRNEVDEFHGEGSSSFGDGNEVLSQVSDNSESSRSESLGIPRVAGQSVRKAESTPGGLRGSSEMGTDQSILHGQHSDEGESAGTGNKTINEKVDTYINPSTDSADGFVVDDETELSDMQELERIAAEISNKKKSFIEKINEMSAADVRAFSNELSELEEKQMQLNDKIKNHPIRTSDVDKLRAITPKRKSVQNLLDTEVAQVPKFQEQQAKKMGAKSAFAMRREGGNKWRNNDSITVPIIKVEKHDLNDVKTDKKNGRIKRGNVVNIDTGITIHIGLSGIEDTYTYAMRNAKRHKSTDATIGALYHVDELVKNAICFDSVISDKNNKNKSAATLFMHQFYAPFSLDNNSYLAKLAVEEFYFSKSNGNVNETTDRLYNLKDIKITPVEVNLGFDPQTYHQNDDRGNLSDATISIPQLYDFVKTYDIAFFENESAVGRKERINEIAINQAVDNEMRKVDTYINFSDIENTDKLYMTGSAIVWKYFNPDGNDGNGQFVELTITEYDIQQATLAMETAGGRTESGYQAFIDYIEQHCDQTSSIDEDFEAERDNFLTGDYDITVNSGSIIERNQVISDFINPITTISVNDLDFEIDLKGIDSYVLETEYENYIGGTDENGHERKDNYSSEKKRIEISLTYTGKIVVDTYDSEYAERPDMKIYDQHSAEDMAKLSSIIYDYINSTKGVTIYSMSNGKRTDIEPPIYGVAKAINLINDFSVNEYGNEADTSDLSKIALAYTTTEDGEHEIQVEADLVNKAIKYRFDGVIYRREQYTDINDMNANGLTGLNFDEMVALSEDEQAFLTDDIPAYMSKSVVAWDEIEDMGYILFEEGYIERHNASEKAIFGNNLKETELFDLANRMHDGEDIRAELGKKLIGRQNYFRTRNDDEFTTTEDGNKLEARYRDVIREISYVELGEAYLKLIENEYNDIIHDRTIEELRDVLKDLSEEQAEELIRVFDNNIMDGWKSGDDQIKINHIKRALYNKLGNDEDKTEKAFAAIADMKYNVKFESVEPEKSDEHDIVWEPVTDTADDNGKVDVFSTNVNGTFFWIEPTENGYAVTMEYGDGSIRPISEEYNNFESRGAAEDYFYEDRDNILAITKDMSQSRTKKVDTFSNFSENTDHYTIYQLPAGEKYHGIRYMSRETLEKEGVLLSQDDYEMVYEGDMSEFDVTSINSKLEGIYAKFNRDHPQDYTGRSVSVSDVITITNSGDETAYYVDAFGFKEMPEFFSNQQKQELEKLNDTDIIQSILRYDQFFIKKKDDIQMTFSSNNALDDRLEYVKTIFNNDYSEIMLTEEPDGRYGYKTDEQGLLIWKGSYLTRTMESHLTWEKIEELYSDMVERNILLNDNSEIEIVNSINVESQGTEDRGGEQLSFFGESEPVNLSDKKPQRDNKRKLLNVDPTIKAISNDMVYYVLRCGSPERGSLSRIVAQYQKGKSDEDNAEFLRKEFGNDGRGYIYNSPELDKDVHISSWFDDFGIKITLGDNVDENLVPNSKIPWLIAARRINDLLENGEYCSQDIIDSAAEREIKDIADRLWYLHQDTDKEVYQYFIPEEMFKGGFPDSTERIRSALHDKDTLQSYIEGLSKLVTDYEQNRDILRFHFHRPKELLYRLKDLQLERRQFTTKPDFTFKRTYFISEREKDALLGYGSGFSDGKFRIEKYFKDNHNSPEQIKFLKDEYGTGGGSKRGGDEWHDAKGITYVRGKTIGSPDCKITMKWNEVASRIDRLVSEGKYITEKDIDDKIHDCKRIVQDYDINTYEDWEKEYETQRYTAAMEFLKEQGIDINTTEEQKPSEEKVDTYINFSTRPAENKQALMSAEIFGENHYFKINNHSLDDILREAQKETPLVRLMEIGEEISIDDYAAIEQSEEFSFGVDFNFNNDTASIYIVNGGKGGVVDAERSDDNHTINEIKLSEYGNAPKTIGEKVDTYINFSEKEPKRHRKTTAEKLYDKFTAMYPDIVSGKHDYERYGEPGDAYEPLTVEALGEDMYAFMTYYEQLGDIMRDPDFTIRLDHENKRVEMLEYQQDGVPGIGTVYQNVVDENGNIDEKLCAALEKNFMQNLNAAEQAERELTRYRDSNGNITELSSIKEPTIEEEPEEVSDDKTPELREVLNAFSEKHTLGELNVEAAQHGYWTLKETLKDGKEIKLGDIYNRTSYDMPFTPESLEKALTEFEQTQLRYRQEISEIGSREYHLRMHGGKSELPKVQKDLPEIKYADNPSQKIRDNITALKEVIRLEDAQMSGRALYDERGKYADTKENSEDRLRRFSGWGGLSQVFDERFPQQQRNREQLHTILTNEEYAAASASTLNAHFTPQTVIDAMYKVVRNMELPRNARILEPSCGSGNFITRLPGSFSDAEVIGVELDRMTAKIAKWLNHDNPNVRIIESAFERAPLENNSFDLAIGNVPFGDYQMNDPDHAKNWLIHDAFFRKALDKVAPGGVVAFITSSGTMDKGSPKVREYLATQAELVGAIRLPNNAFKDAGTLVTSDIIFLKKREVPLAAHEPKPDWCYTVPNEDGLKINSYFVDNPQMVLGKMEKTTHFDMLTCQPAEGADLELQLNEAIKNINAKITVTRREQAMRERSSNIEPWGKNFTYQIKDGKVYYRQGEDMNEVRCTAKDLAKFSALCDLRETTRELLDKQKTSVTDEALVPLRDKLNRLYDTYKSTYGALNDKKTLKQFGSDSDYPILQSLEKNDGSKADIFFRRTVNPYAEITSVENAEQALQISLDRKGKVDMIYMSMLLEDSYPQQSVDEIADIISRELLDKGLVFIDPEKKLPDIPYSGIVEKTAYLSGNVRMKLTLAREYAKSDPQYESNAAALEKVIPEDIKAEEIAVQMGCTWIDTEDYTAFLSHLAGRSRYNSRNSDVSFSPITGEFSIMNAGSKKDLNVNEITTYGTADLNMYQLAEKVLNQRRIAVMREYPSKKDPTKVVTRTDPKATKIAIEKAKKIKEEFKKWIFDDPARKEKYERRYNDIFNSLVGREYDGSKLSFPGLESNFELRPHQKNCVARAIYGGNTLAAHVVGAGKSAVMFTTVMKKKELGLINKACVVVPKPLTEQTANEWRKLYPNAKILTVTNDDLSNEKKRNLFTARVATGAYDAVIMSQEQYEKIPMSNEYRVQFMQKELDKLEDILRQKKSEGKGKRDYSVKAIEKAKKRPEALIEKLTDPKGASKAKDDLLEFEQLGFDYLVVDEAHAYKNGFVITKMTNVAGVTTRPSGRAEDMQMKTDYFNTDLGQGHILFCTGTPYASPYQH